MKTFKDFVMENENVSSESEFEVPVHNVEFLDKKIEKLNKLAAKLGCSPIKLTKSDTFSKMVKPEERKNGKTIPAQYLDFVKIKVDGQAPKLNGWTFVGKREPMEGTDSILAKSAPGHDIPAKFSDDHPVTCDHCGHNRYRKESFIVKHDDGTHKEVGRSCLKDFLGHANPEKYASFAESLYDVMQHFSGSQDPEYGGGGRGVFTFAVRGIVSAAIHAIRQRGFVSRQNEDIGKTATSTQVNLHMNPPKKDPEDFIMPVSEIDFADAEKAIEWMKNHPKAGKEEFWTNMSKLASAEATALKHTGYLSAGANSYLKEVDNLQSKKGIMSTIKSEALGKEGDKVTFKAEVISLFRYENAWGTKSVITAKADSGHLIKMFTSSGDNGVVKGARVEITGKLGAAAEESYDKSPFKGMIVTTMAPRSRIESVLDAETADKHFHVGDKIKFTGEDGKGKIGQIVSKPVFGKFEVQSITKPNAPTIHVSFEDILGLL